MTATELIARILPGHASGKHACPAPEPGDGSEFWGDTGSTGELPAPEPLERLPDQDDDQAHAVAPEVPDEPCGCHQPQPSAPPASRYPVGLSVQDDHPEWRYLRFPAEPVRDATPEELSEYASRDGDDPKWRDLGIYAPRPAAA